MVAVLTTFSDTCLLPPSTTTHLLFILLVVFLSTVHTMGVSAEPEMTEHRVDGNDCFLILATDGIWDVIESAQVRRR
jgi:serine/threonine protein phosphatase PrpC